MGCFVSLRRGDEATHQCLLGAVAYFSCFLLTCALADDVIAYSKVLVGPGETG